MNMNTIKEKKDQRQKTIRMNKKNTRDKKDTTFHRQMIFK